VLKNSSSFVLAWIVFAATASYAEQVTLKNGDHLTGSIVSMDGQKLVLKTTYAGAVPIDWAEGEPIFLRQGHAGGHQDRSATGFGYGDVRRA